MELASLVAEPLSHRLCGSRLVWSFREGSGAQGSSFVITPGTPLPRDMVTSLGSRDLSFVCPPAVPSTVLCTLKPRGAYSEQRRPLMRRRPGQAALGPRTHL